MEQFEKIYVNQCLDTVIEKQVINLLSKKIDSVSSIETDFNEIRKAVWLASILAKSKNEQHLKKVQDLAILIFLNNQENLKVLKVVYVLFSRIGNLTATNHLKNLAHTNEKNTFIEDIILIQELINKRVENSIIVNEKPYLLTDFQKNLFEKIKEEKYISISAPTSSGKSFILKKYIEEESKNNDKYCVFYIVPSRALINQVSEELRIDIPNITIKNAFIENEIIGNDKLIYVITPERAVNIINSENALTLPNLIFIDEIQNVENEDGRGNLFEYVYEELSKVDKTKIITAGPFISNSNEIFKELFTQESKVVNTDLSPVFQLRTLIKLDSDFVSLSLFINNKVSYNLEKIIKIDDISKIFNSNIGKGLAHIIKNLSNNNESNLIYASRGDYAEKWALRYSETIEIENDLENDLQDLIKYVKTDIHPKYFLINCLEKRIAFHHGSLSEFVRKEIETLFGQGIITTLFCTSTLLEGVNLPADNLFVIKPEKNKTELTDFEFGNLIGRAGRIKNTLFGTIYCVSKQNNTKWAEDYYKANYSKEVKTSSSRALPEINREDLTKSSIQIESSKIKNIIISLRNKALRKDGSLETFLAKHNLNDNKKERIINSVKNSIKEATIPYEIVKRNPTIDPLLQDKLFKRVIENVEDWVIHPNSNFNTAYKREFSETIEYKLNSFFWQLDSIISRLNEIFEITNEIWKKDKISISPSGICINAINWIQGKSIGEIIASRIKYYSEDERVKPERKIDATNPNHINKEIKDVIKINLKVVTFSLLKYLKLLVDILDNILTESQKEKHKLTLSLPIQIELGTQEPIVISLITNGIPRTIALKLFIIFKKTIEYKNEIKILEWLKSQNQIIGLEPIYNKFLVKNNFLKIQPKINGT
ncbi:DEAD/DEAH box helicase [Cellulophaga lytica]|uniref:DEAD/DEAH box helicase n=1 Tax=Cellulophaga lytica TaxID=979 RepID=UPI003CE4D710